MKKYDVIIVSILYLALAGIAPNLFAMAQAGISSMHFLTVYVLLPSIAAIVLLTLTAWKMSCRVPVKLAINGIIAGFLATIGLEVVREAGFHLGAMPGDLPKLMGVLMLDQFSAGPDIWSNFAGWGYHFWNGAAFGIIFSLLLGQPKLWQGLIFGILVGIGFMASPVAVALGIGRFGIEFKDGNQFALTVTLAHVAYGILLALILRKSNKGDKGLFNWIQSVI